MKLDHEGFGDMGRTGIPYMFLELLSKAPIERQYYYYWWRAQSEAYIVRFPIILPLRTVHDIAC